MRGSGVDVGEAELRVRHGGTGPAARLAGFFGLAEERAWRP